MEQSERKVWLNGRIMPVGEATVSVLSPTAQFGANVFEGIRCYWNEDRGQLYAFRLKDHYKRLEESIRLLQINSAYTVEEYERYLKDVVIANRYQEDIAVRQTVFVDGYGSWFAEGPVGMFIAPIAKGRKEIPLRERESVCISSWERISDRVLSPRAKVGANYLNSRLAKLEAKRNGYDAALFLNDRGFIAEGTGACFFMIKNKKIITPLLTDSVLESITRDTVLCIARELFLMEIEERSISRTEVYLCDEAFFCGSAAEITPIGSIDRYVVGNGEPGRMTRKIHEAYLQIVTGRLALRDDWVTPIYD